MLKAILFLILIMLPLAGRTDERFFSVLVEGKKAGYARSQITPLGSGSKVTSDCVIKLKMLGSPLDLNYQAIGEYAKPDDVLPTRYTISLVAGPRTITSDCRIKGRTAEFELSSAGNKEKKSMKLPAECYLIEGNIPDTWIRAVKAMARNPRNRTIHVLFPTSGEIDEVSLRWHGKNNLTASLKGQSLDLARNVKTGDWDTVSVPDQKAVFKIADKSAMTGIEGIEAASRAFAVSNVAIDDPMSLDSLKVKIDATVAGEHIDAESLRTKSQAFEGDVKENRAKGTLTIKRVIYDGKDADSLPLTAATKSKLAAYLKPESYVECSDPEITSLATTLTSGCKTTWDAAKTIGDWVHKNIEYKITGTGAKACLKAKSGDCGPHSWLSIALLRAAGIPARITGGAMYTGLLGGSFGQHYWTMVWAGEKPGWIPIDTTSGEIGSLSPGHLNLWKRAGGIAALSVSVLDYAPKASAKASANVASVARRPWAGKMGEEWTFNYRRGGKDIAKETARVKNVSIDGSVEVEYKLDADIPGGKAVLAGDFSYGPQATPRTFNLKVNQSNIEQNISVKVSGNRAAVRIEGVGLKADRTAEIPNGGYVGAANILATMDVILGQIDWKQAKEADMSIYLADILQTARRKLKLAREETITVAGKQIPCLVVSPTDDPNEQWFLETESGRLMRVVNSKAGFTAERK